ncbi:MAG: hypothetical protein M1818_002742 [Claussenomyces sp. TS43310]|nr:MAG: hypothetical protein M1818_002742 [Claussenomyces sp. TS43310]
MLLYTFRYLKSGPRNPGADVESSQETIDIISMVYPMPNLTVDLVMATVVGDDISWTDNIRIPHLNIVRYFADNQKAQYHPEKNKGREATMYLTYIVDHYDSLPDISIFAHAHERPWHVEPVLSNSMAYTLSQLDLVEVQRRGYVNLRVSWQNACPNWIDTTIPVGESQKKEEVYVRQAFLDNFPPTDDQGAVDGVPQYLAQPCCSQFAVARDTILSVPRDQYAKHLKWLLTTELPDYISGRTWEHMFQYLFTKRAVDCPIEWKTLCKMYHVCFQNARYLQNYIELGWEKANLEEKLGFWAEFKNPAEGQTARVRIKEIEKALVDGMVVALKRGKDEKWRLSAMTDIYVD